MTQLFLAYLFAIGLIAGLVLLARRNREQGWVKHRGTLLDVQSAAARDAFAAPPLAHLGDLERLNQSLVSHRDPQPAAPAEKEQHARSL